MSRFGSDGTTDRRAGPRITMQNPAKVLCGAFAWDCTVRDQSDSGLRIQMLSSATPPSNVQLVDLVSGFAHDVKVVWQKDREFGLKILRSHDLRGLAPASLQTAKRIWQAGGRRATAG
ncbi:MAG: PilZ domain-containing protein [Caulobacter sp.]|nr:PilZ domain-containing protein [Caulobacter sp.]